MNLLRGFKVHTRLLLGFGALCLLLLAIAITGALQMRAMAQVTATMFKHPMAVTAEIHAADADIVRMHRGMKDVALSQTPEALKAAVAAVDAAERSAVAHLKLVQERFLGPKPMYVAIEEPFRAWKPIRDRVITLVDEGNTEEAAQITRSEGAKKVAEIAIAVDALAQWAQNKGQSFHDEAQQSAQAGLAMFAAASAVGLALAIVLGLLITRSILWQLGGEPGEVLAVAQAVAGGDLISPIHVRPGAEHSVMAGMAAMQQALSKVVSQVRLGADNIATGSTQIASGNADLSQRTEEQASALQQTAASMEQLSSTVKHNADNARQANLFAQGASEVAVKGGAVVGEVVDTMTGINDSSRRIADIIGVIDGIAFQTNILALNAAVEAARAGEQGRGFAVVASEVRSLAQRSAEAAREIKRLISASVERVDHGTALVDRAGTTMAEIVDAIQRVTNIMSAISSASAEQSQGMAQVGEAVNQMDQVTQQNAALVEESAAAADNLKQQARQLVDAVAVFKLAH